MIICSTTMSMYSLARFIGKAMKSQIICLPFLYLLVPSVVLSFTYLFTQCKGFSKHHLAAFSWKSWFPHIYCKSAFIFDFPLHSFIYLPIFLFREKQQILKGYLQMMKCFYISRKPRINRFSSSLYIFILIPRHSHLQLHVTYTHSIVLSSL